MGFDIVISGRAEGVVFMTLDDIVGRQCIRAEEDRFIVSIVDQAALVAVLARMNDLGVTVERVTPAPRHER